MITNETSISAQLNRLENIHSNIASATWPNGGILECASCKYQKTFNVIEAKRYLKNGWPICHGTSMRLKSVHG